MPSTVRTVLADRVDRLPAAQKQLLQTAAVIGVVVAMRLLRAVTICRRANCPSTCRSCRRRNFFTRAIFYPELEYSFSARADQRGGL